jgi:hypothetical protein
MGNMTHPKNGQCVVASPIRLESLVEYRLGGLSLPAFCLWVVQMAAICRACQRAHPEQPIPSRLGS